MPAHQVVGEISIPCLDESIELTATGTSQLMHEGDSICMAGGASHAQADSPNAGWHNLSFRSYVDYMLSPQFAANLQWVANLARTERCVLMCAEAGP